MTNNAKTFRGAFKVVMQNVGEANVVDEPRNGRSFNKQRYVDSAKLSRMQRTLGGDSREGCIRLADLAARMYVSLDESVLKLNWSKSTWLQKPPMLKQFSPRVRKQPSVEQA